jgi:hypothetical protein
MVYVMVDVEADGPIPGRYSMVSFGAVIVEPGLSRTFYGQLAPISKYWIPKSLAVSGHTREETLKFPEPIDTMLKFRRWLSDNTNHRPIFVSDNPGFDWMFTAYYFWDCLNCNPFGHSSTHLGSLYKGAVGDVFKNFKHLRKTTHSHHPVDDAKGNAEAMLEIGRQFNIYLPYDED